MGRNKLLQPCEVNPSGKLKTWFGPDSGGTDGKGGRSLKSFGLISPALYDRWSPTPLKIAGGSRSANALYDAVILVGWKRSTHLAKKALFSANVKLKPSHMDEEREMKGPFRRLIPDLGLSVC